MQKMVYDCAVEASAIRSANTCTGQLSPPSTRPGLKENDNNIKDMSLTPEEAAEKGLFIKKYPDSPSKPVMLQMAWHNNVRLGCAVKKCSGFYFVVCQYGPG
ncbi:hypothetical protein ANCDUO_11512 [Ancylostoma duodenale]|uniref:SCP domain-containing protein n=1 Tax=Ancylostoma duodenale TaxID=51022 RepID=A0A0C2CNJ5_9BILA|nr:hypothetical protein ANCDUO_11512 [Ancylostoma duodenale]